MFPHGFEHVPDPLKTLLDARERLAPGGRILIRMPTVSSDAWQHYRTDRIQLDPPRHLTRFSRPWMERCADRAGMAVQALRDDSTSVQFWGSEQACRGMALVDARSTFINPRRSPIPAHERRTWDRAARRLNAEQRGDQAAWVRSAH